MQIIEVEKKKYENVMNGWNLFYNFGTRQAEGNKNGEKGNKIL